MTDASSKLQEQRRLRRVAEGLLAQGRAPSMRGWTVGTDALELLHRLASDAERSADALAVLHELQVHQVELDLQLEQLESNEAQLAEELQRYRDLFERAPVAYLRVGSQGWIVEANEAANAMLAPTDGADTGHAEGRRFGDLLRHRDRAAFTAMLQALDGDHAIASCAVQTIELAAGVQTLQITARREPGSDNLWMILSGERVAAGG